MSQYPLNDPFPTEKFKERNSFEKTTSLLDQALGGLSHRVRNNW